MAAGIFLDLASNAVIGALNTFGTAVSATGDLLSVDAKDVVGNMATAILTTSAVSGSGNVTIRITESADNVTFTDVAGATFTAVTAANQQQIISFQTKKRYIGAASVLNSGTSVTCQVTFLGQRRTTPADNGGWVNDAGGS